ncbi:Pleiotropic negative transcriptional regulator [Phlyctochytrium planicorne]|nr:Pleiotropic negative transcriptional regulator [Phlyctochytrium planicorne]
MEIVINKDLSVARAYRSLDQLENFRIRINLAKIASCRVPRLKREHPSSTGLPPPIEVTVKWQKKIYGSCENGQPSEKQDYIYTYIDSDEYEDVEDMSRSITNATKDCPHIHYYGHVHKPRKSPSKNMAPSVQRKMLNNKFRVMHIMASLSIESVERKGPGAKAAKELTKKMSRKRIEKRLCTIKCYDNGLVLMNPGITTDGEINEFEIEDDVYQFSIVNSSRPLTEEDEKREWSIYSEYHVK